LNHSASTRRRSWLAPALIGLGLLVIVGIAYWAVTQGPAQALVSPRGSHIASFDGHGDQVTASFKVRPGWAIHWNAKGDAFAFEIKGDRDLGKVIDIDEPGSGVTSPTGGGTYYLAVTADGDWSIEITQGD
jgi:hypothetical protein